MRQRRLRHGNGAVQPRQQIAAQQLEQSAQHAARHAGWRRVVEGGDACNVDAPQQLPRHQRVPRRVEVNDIGLPARQRGDRLRQVILACPCHFEAGAGKGHIAHGAQPPDRIAVAGCTGCDDQRRMAACRQRPVEGMHVPLHAAMPVGIIGADLNDSHGAGRAMSHPVRMHLACLTIKIVAAEAARNIAGRLRRLPSAAATAPTSCRCRT